MVSESCLKMAPSVLFTLIKALEGRGDYDADAMEPPKGPRCSLDGSSSSCEYLRLRIRSVLILLDGKFVKSKEQISVGSCAVLRTT